MFLKRRSPTGVWTLYYDGTCNLCFFSQKLVRKWLDNRGMHLRTVPLQTPEAEAKGYAGALVLEGDGVFRSADAWLELMRYAPWYLRWISWLRMTAPTRWLAGRFYDLISTYRHRLFGWRTPPAARPTPQSR